MLYFHGGAYFFGSPRSHRAVTWRLSRECRAKVLALDYRQPPDWAYPAPLEDAVRAYKALLDTGYRPVGWLTIIQRQHLGPAFTA
ncbi:alpha/beta hydrolase fold domain-containing protein [Alcanivorax sp. HI0044]|uniref:alpha/beta hydrolase fold domain-containing protein n=1 Tax=Alcanivorax sp. HI0044 TaxID=1822234 RepID=UPI001E650632|nr:alpha/beta hydrolase fold domain-containing protein [Alcanivorax sp. HI0044]